MRHAPVQMSLLGRLTPAVALAIAIGLLVIGLAMAFYNEHAHALQKAREARVQAEILASIATAALVFDDRKAALEYVEALSVNPEISAAAIYDSTGARFAGFSRSPETQFSRSEPSGALGRARNNLVVRAPVIEGGNLVGMVYVKTVVEAFQQRLQRYAAIGLLVVMASLVLAVLGMAQGALRAANRELAERASALAAANESLQAQIEEREKAEQALRQAQKMETIGQLTGGIAHDFNNLLTIILGNLERIRNRLASAGKDEVIAAAIDHAVYGAERAAALTKSLLAFARRQPLTPKPVEVNHLVTGMSNLLRRALGEAVNVKTSLAEDLWLALADPNQLENAILNLAVNARDAMPGGGRLTIGTANVSLDAHGAGTAKPGPYVRIEVADTGTGMSRDVLAQVFEPFFTTKDVGHGTGLGLSQVYGFVQQSDGHVEIESEVGRGTIVRLYLPRAAESQDRPETIEDQELPHQGRLVGTILMVEDELHVRQHSAGLLREMGFRVLEAADGPAALELLRGRSGIDLLFTDVGLPKGMSGRELAREARTSKPELKILLTSGYARDAASEQGAGQDDLALLPKPFTQAELKAAILKALDKSHPPRRALVVEDEFLIRMMAVDYLNSLGFEVREAANAAQAMQSIGTLDGNLDVVLLDVGLPDRTGDSLAIEIRSLRDELPIVIATGYTAHDLAERFAADRRMGFIQKPYDAARLAAALKKVGALSAG